MLIHHLQSVKVCHKHSIWLHHPLILGVWPPPSVLQIPTAFATRESVRPVRDKCAFQRPDLLFPTVHLSKITMNSPS